MRKKVSPTFIAAGVVVSLACFVLLSMLFYSPSDYFERASQVAGSHGGGFRFSVASTFFQPFGVAAYIAWLIILLWAVIVFFKEAVGELALRGVSLVVVVVSGASVAHLLGSDYLGGHLGYTIGSFFSTALGDTLGVVVMGGIFAVSFLLATDFGFVSYFQEARAALAEPEEETGEDGGDLVAVIERTVREVEAESELAIETVEEPELAAGEPALADLPPEVIVRGEDEPLRLNLRPRIEVEALDEDLLVAGPAETEAETETEIEAGDEATEETEIEDEPEVETVEEPEAEAPPAIHLDDEIRVAVPEPEEDEYDALAAATADLEAALARRQGTAPEVEEPEAEDATEEDEGAHADAAAPTSAGAVETEAVEEPPVAENEPEAVADPGAVRRDAMRDLDSVFDALVGLAPSAEAPGAEEAPEPEPAAEPVEARAEPEPAPEPDPEPELIEEEASASAFVLDDEIVMGYRAVPGEMPAEEPEEEAGEEAEPAPAASIEPAPAPAPAVESEPMEPVAEPAGPAILLDDVIVTSAGAAVEDEEPMFPFMAGETGAGESGAGTGAPAVGEPPVEEPADEESTPAVASAPPEAEPPVEEAEEEIPVLRDVSEEQEETSKGVFQSLFARKKGKEGGRDRDPLLADAARLVLERGRASVVLLQRRLDIGYTRASRLVDAMEREGLVGPLEESGSRAVVLSFEEWEARLAE